MTPEELKELIRQPEGLKLDFKREYQLNKTPSANIAIEKSTWITFINGQWNEFTKDILALANGNVGTAEQTGRLVIGVGDQRYSDGTRDIFDTSYLQLDPTQIIQKVNTACDPPIPNINCDHVELNGKQVFVISIPPSPYVHETTKQLDIYKLKTDNLTGRLTVSKEKMYSERTVFIRRAEGTYPATDDERRTLAADKSPETIFVSEPSIVLDEYLIQQSHLERIENIFEESKGYSYARDILHQKNILWIVGVSGIGKRTLAIKLASLSSTCIFIVPRFIEWSQLVQTGVHNSTLILPDALGAIRFERKKLESELSHLEKLIERGNTVIITSPEDVFTDAVKEVRIIDWLSKTYSSNPFFLKSDDYAFENKLEIYKKMITFAYEVSGLLSDIQYKWSNDLISLPKRIEQQKANTIGARNHNLFQRLLIDVWLPIDIDRFVFVSLPNSKSADDIWDLLRLDADINNRVHSWFMELDDSTRCFILTLSLFVGSEAKEIWNKYKEIVSALRNLDPNLSIFPLGILRQRATPYVTKSGTVDFVNPRVFKAVVNEVSKNYREYFVELIPLLRKWSIPDLPSTITKEERENRLDNTEDTRNAIARMAGEVSKYGLNDITAILEAWATNPFGTIGKTAGIVLRETVIDPTSAQDALNLIHEWAFDFSSPNKKYHRWAAGSALWRIASIKSRFDLTNFSLRHLQKLAKDFDPYVVSSAAHAFRMLGRTVTIQDMIRPLSDLANENDVFTRQQIAYAVDEAASQNKESAYQLLNDWLISGQENVVWTVTYILLTSHNISRQERHAKLETIITSFTLCFTSALYHALLDEKNKEIVSSVLETLVNERQDILISKLIDIKQQNSTCLDELQSLLIVAENASIRNIPSAIDNELQRRSEEERLERERIEKEQAKTEQVERIRHEREQYEINQLRKMVSWNSQQRNLILRTSLAVVILIIVLLLAGWINSALNSTKRNLPTTIDKVPTPTVYISSPITEAVVKVEEPTITPQSYKANATPIVCNGFTSLLHPGTNARVVNAVGVNVRKNAGTGYEITGILSTNEKVEILKDPPICNEGYLWWRVESTSTSISGWVVEGTTKDKWLSP